MPCSRRDDPEQPCNCEEIFNNLSKADKVKLQGAALTKALSGFVRDDTEENPWRYPFYVGYMAAIATPLPFFGASTVLVAGTVYWASKSRSEYAQRLNGRITEAFNDHALLACEHKDYILPAEQDDDKYINNSGLVWHTTKSVGSDTWEATKSTYNSAKRWLLG